MEGGKVRAFPSFLCLSTVYRPLSSIKARWSMVNASGKFERCHLLMLKSLYEGSDGEQPFEKAWSSIESFMNNRADYISSAVDKNETLLAIEHATKDLQAFSSSPGGAGTSQEALSFAIGSLERAACVAKSKDQRPAMLENLSSSIDSVLNQLRQSASLSSSPSSPSSPAECALSSGDAAAVAAKIALWSALSADVIHCTSI